MEYYYNNKGQIGVLTTCTYGFGWSTWDWMYDAPSEEKYALALDKRVIEYYFEKHADKEFMRRLNKSWRGNPEATEVKQFFTSLGYNNVQVPGFANLMINWVDPNSLIHIEEYDGMEILIVADGDPKFWTKVGE